MGQKQDTDMIMTLYMCSVQAEKAELLTDKVQLLAKVREQAREQLIETRDYLRSLAAQATCSFFRVACSTSKRRPAEAAGRSQATWSEIQAIPVSGRAFSVYRNQSHAQTEGFFGLAMPPCSNCQY